ncbi:hypothetical protein P7C70_g439, partial [Phenoliferia sp. Uapishka_3]
PTAMYGSSPSASGQHPYSVHAPHAGPPSRPNPPHGAQQQFHSIEPQAQPPPGLARPFANQSNPVQFPQQPPRQAPPPPPHPFRQPPPSAPPRQYDSPPQYGEAPRSMHEGAQMSMGGEQPQVAGPSTEYRMGPDPGAAGVGGSSSGAGHRDGGQVPEDRRAQQYAAHTRTPTAQQTADPEPSHRILFHSYILDYLQKQGFHSTAAAFLQDAPDTNVQRTTPLDRATNKGKGRSFNEDDQKASSSDFESNSPAPPRGSSGDDLNSPSGPLGAESTASTNSSLSNFGFGAPQSNGTSPPQSSPESGHLALQPRALVQIETREGFLYEWWAVFWDVFRARSGKGGTPPARAFVDVSNATLDAITQRRKQISFDDPLSLPQLQQINPQAFLTPTGHPNTSAVPTRPPPSRPSQDPNAHLYAAHQRRVSQPAPHMVQRPALPAQMTQAQAVQHAENQARYAQSLRPPQGSNPGQSSPGPPPPAGVSRQLMLNRRGAISPAPLPTASAPPGPDPAMLNRQRLQISQQAAQNAFSAQQQHHMQQQQAQQHQQQHQQQLQQQQLRWQQERGVAQQQQAMSAQGDRFSRPTSAMGGPPPQRQASQASNHEYGTPQPGMMDINRQRYPPAGYGTPQAAFSPQPQSIDSYRAQLGANQSHALSTIQQTASPRGDISASPYPTDRPTPTANGVVMQGGPSPYPTYVGTPEYGAPSPAFNAAMAGHLSRPASAGGSAAFREQQQDGSMPPPPPAGQRRPTPQAPTPQALGQTPSASQYGSPTPQTPNTQAAAPAGGKRRRESTKDAREPKKRVLKGRERSESNASNVQAPTTSPVILSAPPAAAEYSQSPGNMVDASPRPGSGDLSVNDHAMDSNAGLPDGLSALGDQFQSSDEQHSFAPSQNTYESHDPNSSYNYLQGSAGTAGDPLGFGLSGEEFNFEEFMNFPDVPPLQEAQNSGLDDLF